MAQHIGTGQKVSAMPGNYNGDKFGTGSEIGGGWNASLKETLIQKLLSSQVVLA